MSLSNSKCWYSNNCLHFLKCAVPLLFISLFRRYLKKSRLLKFCYVPATSAASFNSIFATATNGSNQTNKAGSKCH